MKLMTFVKVMMVLTLGSVGLGFYQGWFVLSNPSHGTESDKVNISLQVDPDEVKQDAKAVRDKTTELVGKATKDAKGLGRKTREAESAETKERGAAE